jgi:FtsP/CotA-like multicopper oxidase with cupredoxin domain
MRAHVPALLLVGASLATAHGTHGDERTLTNDNRTAAGVVRAGVLTLSLEARAGIWHPNGDDSPGVALPAFAEAGHAPQIPGPLIRVQAGTEVAVTVRNTLPNDTLVVHGLHDRVGAAIPTVAQAGVRLAPGEARALRFRLAVPGTYYYWGTTTGRDINWRTGEDGQLTGAIVVDTAGAPPKRDRILVIGMWTDTVARAYVPRRRILAVINGRTWPSTERLVYDVGDTVRWHVINASGDNHPMHLHGFYFRVDSRGDGRADTTRRADDEARVVTGSMSPGTTMHITWLAERPGNWLFHCHLPEHFGRRGPLGTPPEPVVHTASHDASADMGGLVMGIEVHPAITRMAQAVPDTRRRQIRLLVRRNEGGSDDTPFYGFAIQDGATLPAPDSGLHVGPPLVLVRGEPVSITVVNTLNEPTAVHWHGIELESYYDGVAGFSGAGQRIAPAIAPRDSFEARFTPPRAGTFIYHTHVDELRQEPAGLAGPIVVLNPGERWDPSTDHPVMITSPWSWDEGRRAVLVNGTSAPAPLVLRADVAHRFRVINMTTRRPALRVELRRDSTLLAWRELAKDGASLPEPRRRARPAVHQISVGETFDVEVTPDAPGDLRLDVVLGGVATAHPVLGTLPIRVYRGK